MTGSNTLLKIALLAAAGLLPAACASRSAPPANPGMSGMSGTPGMQGHAMAGHDMGGGGHQAMMAQCADMRRQMAQGTHQNTPGMAQMMANCDQMDRVGAMPGAAAPSVTAAPAATRSR